MNNSLRIANHLVKEHRNKINFKTLPTDLLPLNMDEAYLAQQSFHEQSGRGELGGHKIALASKVQQELCGIDHPIAGGIFKNEIFNSPHNIEIQNYHGLGLEFELAMEISSDLDESIGKLNENNVKNYISNIYTAFELIIDRNADYSKINALTMTADNVWCGGVVLGNKINNWKNLDFNALQSTLLWNDEAPQKAFIKDATPFRTLAWVINVRLSQNINIPSGSKIITGSVIKTRAPKKGDHIIYKIDRLSQVEVKII